MLMVKGTGIRAGEEVIMVEKLIWQDAAGGRDSLKHIGHAKASRW